MHLVLALWLRISFYTPEDLVDYGEQLYLTKSGEVATEHSAAVHLDLYDEWLGKTLFIPGLSAIGAPTEYKVHDSGSFDDREAVDLFLPWTDNDGAMEVISQLDRVCTELDNCRHEWKDGVLYSYLQSFVVVEIQCFIPKRSSVSIGGPKE